MRNDKENIIVEKTFKFTVDLIVFVEVLEAQRKYAIANQLLRSGGAVGALVREAQNAESKADFIHKMKIAAKEADESNYWLKVCKASPSYPDNHYLLHESSEILLILNKIISSSKRS